MLLHRSRRAALTFAILASHAEARMSTIVIHRSHHLSHEDARAAAEKVAAHLQERFDLAYQWEGDVLVFDRPGVSGEMEVAPEEIKLSVRLGFMLGMFATSIEREIHKNLDDVLGTA